MSDRKNLSPKTRFEVFKRDKFTCQYCGRTAPDVVLEVDHINPVASGGTNDMMNLVTSCWECNHGKGARELSDDSTVKRQQAEMQRRADRREQLQFMAEWRKELIDIAAQERESKEREIDDFFVYMQKRCNMKEEVMSSSERTKIKTLIKRYGFEKLIKAVDTFIDEVDCPRAYYAWMILDRLGRYAYDIDHPNAKSVFYLRKIILNRFPNESAGHEKELAFRIGNSLQNNIPFIQLKDLFSHCKTYGDIEMFLFPEIFDCDAEDSSDEKCK